MTLMKPLTFALFVFAGTASAQDVAWAEKTPALGQAELPVGVLSPEALMQLRALGEDLFAATFTPLDGAGRPRSTQAGLPTKTKRPLKNDFARTSGPDAGACGSCHNLPILGGAGDFVTNVFASEGFANHDFETTDGEFSLERGTNHLFGAGLIELLAREMTDDLYRLRDDAISAARDMNAPKTVVLETKGVGFGMITAMPDGLLDLSKIEGVDADLVIRPFTQKGVVPSLRQFAVNAMNQHHGMQASERFGTRWTGESDFDEDGYSAEMSAGDISALVAWQAGLPVPTQARDLPQDWIDAATRGKDTFAEMGCVSCHRPALPLRSLAFADPGPFDTAGTLSTHDVETPAIYDLAGLEWAAELPRDDQGRVLVPLWGDLKRHEISDGEVDALGNELFGQGFVDRTQFITAELWGVGSTAPYGHRNDMPALDQVIRAHGGDARAARDAYVNSDQTTQLDIIAFLKSLRIETQ